MDGCTGAESTAHRPHLQGDAASRLAAAEASPAKRLLLLLLKLMSTRSRGVDGDVAESAALSRCCGVDEGVDGGFEMSTMLLLIGGRNTEGLVPLSVGPWPEGPRALTVNTIVNVVVIVVIVAAAAAVRRR